MITPFPRMPACTISALDITVRPTATAALSQCHMINKQYKTIQYARHNWLSRV